MYIRINYNVLPTHIRDDSFMSYDSLSDNSWENACVVF